MRQFLFFDHPLQNGLARTARLGAALFLSFLWWEHPVLSMRVNIFALMVSLF
jgi:hypothetical protein